MKVRKPGLGLSDLKREGPRYSNYLGKKCHKEGYSKGYQCVIGKMGEFRESPKDILHSL